MFRRSRVTGGVDVEIVEDAADLEAIRPGWDALAVAAGRPYCAPAWMLAWWQHRRSGDARLRAVVLRDAAGLLAVAPFFAQVGRLGLTEYRLLGAGFSHRIGVVCRAGEEQRAAVALGSALRTVDPRPSSVVWEGVDARDAWPERTASAMRAPLGTAVRTDLRLGAPTLRLPDGTFDAWFGATTKKFRQGMRRDRRALERAGGHVRRSLHPHELDRDIATLARLHAARWAHRGGADVLDRRGCAVLAAAGAELLARDRFRLYIAELEGTAIGAVLLIAAGGSVAFWAGGMDDAHGTLSPARLALLSAVEECFARGDRRLDLGGGTDAYKRRFANADEPLLWRTVFPRGPRYPLTRAQLLPKHAYQEARSVARRLPPERQAQLKRVLRRP